MICIIVEQLNTEKEKKQDNLIRALFCDIVGIDEVQRLIDHGILKEFDDLWNKMQLLSYHISVMIDARGGIQVTVTPTIFNAENKQYQTKSR